MRLVARTTLGPAAARDGRTERQRAAEAEVLRRRVIEERFVRVRRIWWGSLVALLLAIVAVCVLLLLGVAPDSGA